jgi:hypothetical protein
MKFFKILAGLAIFTLAAPLVVADEHETRPSISANRTVTFSAEVVAIDHEAREVTLAGDDGQTVSFTARAEARNLGQVKAGDRVFAEMYEEVSISVHANPNQLQPAAAEMTATERTEAGEMPGAAAMDTVVISALVEEINIENNTFKLKMSDGAVREFVAQDPENLKRSKVGDLVIIGVTQAFGIVVQRPDGAAIK